jgi:hypothetical protein
MKTLALTLAFLAGLPLALAAQVSKEDLKKLCAAGISDEVILSYVKANGPVAKLSAEDVIELKQAGASEKLLSTVLNAPAPAPAAERVVEKNVVLTRPATTSYVYDTPYYYTPSAYSYYDYYPTTYYYPTYSYYPRYYGSYYYPRSYSSYCYPSFSVGFSSGRWCGTRGSFGVSSYRR